ncbi:MAG: TonB-dependent receptor, partial [Nitrospirae bacterium]
MKRKGQILNRLLPILVLIIFVFPLTSYSEETLNKYLQMSLEELMQVEVETVSTASRYTQHVMDAPSSVTVITAEEIRRFGYRSLADILNSVKGLYISYDRNYHYLGIRGYSIPGDFNSKVLLMINGHRINDGVFNTSPIGTEFPVDIDLVKKVEIIRGPTSSLYGTNAFFGVINVITFSPEEIKSNSVTLEAGSEEWLRGLFLGRVKGSDLNGLLLSGSFYKTSGKERLYFEEFDTPSNNHGIAEDMDRDRAERLFFRAGYGDFSLHALYSYRKKKVPTATYETLFGHPGYETIDEYYMLGMDYNKSLDNGANLKLKLNLNAYNNYADYPYDYSEEGDRSDVVINKDVSEARWIGGEGVLERRFGKNRLTIGGEFRFDLREYQKNYDREVYFEDERDEASYALFFQDEVKFSEKLTLNAGLRYDLYDEGEDSLNPRLALIWRPFEKTTLKFLFGTAFRKPNAYERFYDDEGLTQKMNPNLDNERIRTYEFALEHNLSESLTASISAYNYIAEDLITLVRDQTDGLLMYDNLGRVNAKGIETELVYRGGAPLMLFRVSYSYQYAKDEDQDDWLPNSPRHTGVFAVSYPISGEKLIASLEGVYNSSRKTLSGGQTGDVFNLNLSFSGKGFMDRHVRFGLNIYNLLNRKYYYP